MIAERVETLLDALQGAGSTHYDSYGGARDSPLRVENRQCSARSGSQRKSNPPARHVAPDVAYAATRPAVWNFARGRGWGRKRDDHVNQARRQVSRARVPHKIECEPLGQVEGIHERGLLHSPLYAADAHLEDLFGC